MSASHNQPYRASPPPRRRWVRFALPLFVFSLLIALTGVLVYRSMSAEIRRETHRTLAVIAEQKRQQVEHWIVQTRIDAELHFLADAQLPLLLEQWLEGGREDAVLMTRMQGRMTDLARVRGWSGLSVLDTDLRSIFSIGETPHELHESRLREILQRPRIETLDLHRGAQGRPQYGLLIPIGGPPSTPLLGIAYLCWRADQSLYPLVESWPVPTRTAETYLVRRDGAGVRFLTPLRHQPDAALTLLRPLATPDLPAARAVEGERGILAGGRDYRGVPVLAYAAAVQGSPWLMLAEIDEREAYAGIQTMTQSIALIVGLGLLLVYSAAYQLWRRDRQRLELAALQAQRAAESRFRVIFEQAPLGVALRDSDSGRIIEANQRFAEIVGRTPQELVGLDPIRLTHPEDVAESRALTARLKSGEISAYRQNKRYLQPSGAVVWASLSCAPVQVDTEETPRYLSIVEDITARKQMEERLRISETRHRLLADNAVDVIWTMDLEGRYSYVGPAVVKLRGYTPEEVLRQSIEDILTPQSLAVARDYFARLHANLAVGLPPAIFRGELEQRRKDGSTVWTDVTISPLLGTDGTFVEILGVTRDISERKRYEHELRQASAAAAAANAAKSEFLAHISHEIRTPLNAVLGLAQVLEREPLSGNQRDMIERIRAAGQSLLTILNDVLDLSKIEAGQLRIEPRPFDLATLLSGLESLMGAAASAKGLTLRIVPPRGLPGPLRGDGLRLEQVLLNLLGNAIKFTEHGEVVLRVTIREQDANQIRLRFRVQDTGIGIAPAALVRLFNPFTQADAGISRRFGGTGLGLSICKRLVELMGGAIGVESQLERGSTFWIELPFTPVAEEMASAIERPPPAAPSGPRLARARVLVVDDSAMSRDLVERALALEGADTILAADGQQAVQILRTRPDGFDVVLMDIQMPVMDGLTAIQMIRGELGLTALPIIAFTAGVGDTQQAAARAAGADALLAKPVDLDQMAILLASWIKTPGPAARSVEPAALETEPAQSEVFPEIPGIDRERVTQRLGHDRSMFLGLLALFVDDFADVVERTREDLAKGDQMSAARRMHTLRGNAGFLCALDLMASASTLEEAITHGEHGLKPRLDALESQITALITASAPWR